MLAFNLALVFALEIAAFVALAVVGAELGGVVLAIAFPVVAGVLWALFAAPKARYDSPAAAAATKLLVFGGAVAGLAGTGHVALAVALGVLVVLNHAVLARLGHDVI